MPDQPDTILRLPKLLRWTGLSRSTLYRKLGNDSFSRPIRIRARCIGWRESASGIRIRNPVFYSVDDHPDA